MKQRLILLIVLLLVGLLLIGLNVISYSPKDSTAESEIVPNRSTFNAGPTGSQALFTLMAETGRRPVRWQQPPAALLTARGAEPEVFVMTGSYRRELTSHEAADVLEWVSRGGRLVLIDRTPPAELVITTSNWSLNVGECNTAGIQDTDPAVREEMVGNAIAAKPVQPASLASNVNSVQLSKFAARVTIERLAADGSHSPPDEIDRADETSQQSAPIIYYSTGEKNVVVGAPFGKGSIVVVSDPYIISNGGIALADNAQFALNLVEATPGKVAFDEYHHGYGADQNRFLQFFSGTPVIAIFLQGSLMIALIFYSRSRRFGRAILEDEPNRLSKLEYVGAMAELQTRSGAYDLAVENIYLEYRRRVIRTLALRPDSTLTEIADAISEHTDGETASIHETMHAAEEIIRGVATTGREVRELIDRLRAIENELGIGRAERKGHL